MILKLKITALCVGILCLLKSTAAADVNATKTPSVNPSGMPSISAIPSVSPAPSGIPSSLKSSVPSVSPAPSGIPSSSPSPSVSSAPTEYCKCCNCTHTSGCQPDPHYTVWDSSNWYDFQGSCDQIAIDNNILQLQIRTRPRGGGFKGFSAITEVGLIMKQTGEIFHARATGSSAIVENNITLASGASYSSASYYHKIDFTVDNSFIKVNAMSSGLSVQVQGQGSTFTDSEGMFGSWNYGGARFLNGTVFDLSGGYWDVRGRSIELAESWKVASADSLMDSPSDVCHPSPVCIGDDATFECDEYENRRLGDGRKLQGEVYPDCTRTCDDITVPLLREICERDKEITGDPTWACEPNYVDPVFVESNECEFEKLDDEMCYKSGDECQRLGGFCKINCESTDDHVCLPGLCSKERSPLETTRFLKADKAPKAPKAPKAAKEAKAPKAAKKTKPPKAPEEDQCMCFVAVEC